MLRQFLDYCVKGQAGCTYRWQDPVCQCREGVPTGDRTLSDSGAGRVYLQGTERCLTVQGGRVYLQVTERCLTVRAGCTYRGQDTVCQCREGVPTGDRTLSDSGGRPGVPTAP